MAESDDVLSLANMLATSTAIDGRTGSDLRRLMVSQAEQVPNTMRRLQTPQLAEALMLTVETGDAIKRLQDALLPVAEAGGMSALVQAISLSSVKQPDVNALSKALFQAMEGDPK
jgi:hypothetical protein